MRLLRHSNGERISVAEADLIGSGGEARVYAVSSDLSLVAKVYHRPTAAQLCKLRAMLANPPDDPTRAQAHISIAWPVDLLSMAYGERGFAGFLMPRAADMRPLFNVYNPSVRRLNPHPVDYRFLHRAARNLAASVRALHGRGYVIGDMNESNILVAETALATLVDTDSFQVGEAGDGAVYRCPVGKPEYTPPELQGKRFTSIDRAAEHDRFGLAVLIFQLLMEGAHPFSGRYTGLGEPPPFEARIAAGHFPYGNRHGQYDIPPAAPPFSVLDPVLRQLFLRCFEDGHVRPDVRPDANIWQNALARAEEALTVCGANPLHLYGGHLAACPWCERRDLLGGRDPFPAGSAAGERRPRRIPASSLLPPDPAPTRATRAGSVGAAQALPSAGAAPAASAANWQAGAPLSASAFGAASTALPVPTLFSYRVGGNAWAWGALFWAVLAAASAPLGLLGLNWAMAALSVGFGITGWVAGPNMVRMSRWISAGSAVCACMSLALRPLTAIPLAGAGGFSAGSGGVRSLSFSPDATKLAAGTSRVEDSSLTPGEVDVWDAAAQRLILTPERASGDVVSVAFSPDGRSLVAATDTPFGSGEVVMLNASAYGAYRSVYKSRRHMRQAAWSPTGSAIAAVAGEPLVRVWDAATLETIGEYSLPGEASTLAFSPDGKRLAVGCRSPQGSVSPGFVTVWDIESGRRVWSKPAHGNGVEAVAFNPRSSVLASGGNDGAICLWDASSGRLIRRQTAHTYGIAALAFSADGAELASAQERQTDSGSIDEIVLRDASTGVPLRTLSGSSDAVQALAFAPKGGLLASGSRDGSIRLWRVERR
jgi:hypothetical protein